MRTDFYSLAMREERVPLSPRIREPVKHQLDALVAQYGDERGMQQWCVEAALLAFFDTDPKTQRDWIQRVRVAQMEAGTSGIVSHIKAKQAKKSHISKD